MEREPQACCQALQSWQTSAGCRGPSHSPPGGAHGDTMGSLLLVPRIALALHLCAVPLAQFCPSTTTRGIGCPRAMNRLIASSPLVWDPLRECGEVVLQDQHEIQPLPAESRPILQQSMEGRERKPHGVEKGEEAVARGSCRPSVKCMQQILVLMKQIVSLQNI